MIKSGIDQDALAQMFSQATVKQGEALRKSVGEATLKALQSRELTMENIRKVLKAVTQATSTGAAQNSANAVDVEALLGKAFGGMDAALLHAVEANRKALQQFVDQGVGLQEKHLKDALANVEKMEDMFFSTVSKAAQGVGQPLKGPWDQVLETMKLNGTDTGAKATATVEQLIAQAQGAMRGGRAASVRTAQTLTESYSALVSGVLIGMSEGLRQVGTAATRSAAKPGKAAKK